MPHRLTARDVFTNPVHFLAYGFGSGLSPWAPGTAGTLAGVPLYLLLMFGERWIGVGGYLGITLLLFIAGIFICGYTAARLGVEDPGAVNWDEAVGYLVTMAFAPFGVPWIILGFVLFRFFDILKPWPIRWFDRNVKGGLGIMLDDVVAAVFSAIALYIIVQVAQKI